MGTTLTALQSDEGVSYQWVIAIEGVDYLLTDGPTAAAITAWAATEWEDAIGGLFVEADFAQTIDPWQPIQPGEDLTFYVRDEEGTDRFGIDVFAGGAGFSTYLPDTIDGNDTTITLLDGAQFSSAGTVYVGTERIDYGSKSTNDLTSCVRGMFAPFKANTESEQRFGRYHRAGATPYTQNTNPRVTTVARTWKGKWVGLWLHRRVGGTLDTRANAQLVWAGKVAEIRDTANGDTRVTCSNVMSAITECVLLRDQWTAEVRKGVYLAAGNQFRVERVNAADGTTESPDPLVVVDGASGDEEIEEGYYSSIDSLIAVLNRWLSFLTQNGDLTGNVRFTVENRDEGPRVVLNYDFGSLNFSSFGFAGPAHALRFLGFETSPTGPGGEWSIVVFGVEGKIVAAQAPMTINPWNVFESGGTSMDVVNPAGVFVDQDLTMPAVAHALAQPLADGSETWGLIEMEGAIFAARMASATSFNRVIFVPELQFLGRGITQDDLNKGMIGRRADAGDAGPMIVRQVIILEGSLEWLVPRLFASTGTAGYNHATYDALGYGLGAAVPWELLGDRFVASCARLDAGQTAESIYVLIEKPTRLVEVLAPDLIMRRSHLVWKNGTLFFTSWSTPAAETAIHDLTEDNKASPADARDAQRSPTDLTEKWLRNIVKIDYNRVIGEDTYRNTVSLEDRASIDDLGEQRAFTIKARNTYSEYVRTGGAIESLIPALLAWMPFFSRPVKLVRRTIDMSLFEDVAPGDIVTISDNFARDPSTGRRGIADKAGIIVSHRWSAGGPDPGNPRATIPMEGEVDIAIFDLALFFTWSPAALVDSTANTGGFTAGYNSGTNTVRCVANEYTLSADGVTDTSYFAANDEVTVLEIDPSSGTGLSWDRVISSKSGNDLTLSSALTAFDTAKKYRVVPQKYFSVGANQQVRAFQADSVDARIQDSTDAHLWGADGTTQTNAPPAYTLADLPERYVARSYDDGSALDVGFETGLIRMAINLANYKTAPQCPAMNKDTEFTATVTTSWRLLAIEPYFVGPALYPRGLTRKLYLAPWFYTVTGTHSLRVSLCRYPPSGDSVESVTLGGPFSSVTFTTSTTTVHKPTSQGLRTTPAQADGSCFLVYEVDSDLVRVQGLAECYLGPLESL